MITPKLPPKVQIDKHIPSGYVILGYTEKQMHDYALELSIEYNKQLIKRVLDLENKQIEMNAGWVRACDEELINLHIGVANLSDSYASAKEKLQSLIDLHITIATDPAVNGGYKLVPIETSEAQQVAVPEGNWLWCKLMDFCKRRGYAPADFDDLFAIVGEARAQQVTLPAWKAERIDDYEIRVTSREGESWRLRSADRNDSFNNFIWRWAESMVNKGA